MARSEAGNDRAALKKILMPPCRTSIPLPFPTLSRKSRASRRGGCGPTPSCRARAPGTLRRSGGCNQICEEPLIACRHLNRRIALFRRPADRPALVRDTARIPSHPHVRRAHPSPSSRPSAGTGTTTIRNSPTSAIRSPRPRRSTAMPSVRTDARLQARLIRTAFSGSPAPRGCLAAGSGYRARADCRNGAIGWRRPPHSSRGWQLWCFRKNQPGQGDEGALIGPGRPHRSPTGRARGADRLQRLLHGRSGTGAASGH
jgi:hypothetical protein